MLIRLILAAFCATAATAQTLDTVVRFPYEVEGLFHVPGGNKLYVTAYVRDSETTRIYVLDCASMAVRKVIPTGTLHFYAGRHRGAWCPRHDKVYLGLYPFPSPDTGGLVVIDNATDSVALRLPVGVDGRAITYNSVRDKLYAASPRSGGAITVLDCAADTVLATITPPDYQPGSFVVWDSAGDKVFVGNGGGWQRCDQVTVIDCKTDSLVAVIYTSTFPFLAVYNPLRRKLYAGHSDGFGIAVIDCATNSVIKRFDSTLSADICLPAYCSAEDKVYWPVPSLTQRRPDTINVIDCATDSVIRGIPAPRGGRGGYVVCAYAPWNNRLYVATSDSDLLLTVFDCRTDSIIGQTRFGSSFGEIVCNPVDHRIYVSDFWDSAVYVFRENLQPVAEEPEHGSDAMAMRVWPNPARDWLWVRGPGQLILYSAGGQRLLALAPGRNRLPDDLAAGVYFVRAVSREPSAVNCYKVVLAR